VLRWEAQGYFCRHRGGGLHFVKGLGGHFMAQLLLAADGIGMGSLDLWLTVCTLGVCVASFSATAQMNAGYAGRLAGINGKALPANEAAAALEASLASWLEGIKAREEAIRAFRATAAAARESSRAGGGGGEGGGGVLAEAVRPPKDLGWMDMCDGVATAVALALVRGLLHPTKATVIFGRTFEQSAERGGGALQPSWALGAFLERAAAAERAAAELAAAAERAGTKEERPCGCARA